MEKIDTLILLYIGVSLVAAFCILVLAYAFYGKDKPVKTDDDVPGRYSEIFDSERPYVEM